MKRIVPYLKRHCTANSIGFIFTIMGIVSSTITIIYFTAALINYQQYKYIYDYTPTTCNPTSGYAFSLTCNGTTKWISILRDVHDRTVVENPFALRNSRQDAIDDRYRSNLNVNQSCFCLSYFSSSTEKNITIRDCSVWPQCILDTDFIFYMQKDTKRYEDTYISFIVASAISLVLSLMGLPFTITLIIRRCNGDDKYIAV